MHLLSSLRSCLVSGFTMIVSSGSLELVFAFCASERWLHVEDPALGQLYAARTTFVMPA